MKDSEWEKVWRFIEDAVNREVAELQKRVGSLPRQSVLDVWKEAPKNSDKMRKLQFFFVRHGDNLQKKLPTIAAPAAAETPAGPKATDMGEGPIPG